LQDIGRADAHALAALDAAREKFLLGHRARRADVAGLPIWPVAPPNRASGTAASPATVETTNPRRVMPCEVTSPSSDGRGMYWMGANVGQSSRQFMHIRHSLTWIGPIGLQAPSQFVSQMLHSVHFAPVFPTLHNVPRPITPSSAPSGQMNRQ
jgi:hypothetical protein